MYMVVKVQPSHTQSAEIKFMYKIMQFQVNLNNTITCHKLQGMSKDALIISSLPHQNPKALFKNWECVVLSHVRKLKGLYLFEPMDMNQFFDPLEQFNQYMICARRKEN